MRRGASPLMLVLVLLSAFVLPGCGSSNGGGTVITVLAGWTGAEGAGFKAMLSGFETKYGIQVDYTGTREEDAVLASDLQNGNPPDLAVVATLGELKQFAAQGVISPIDRALNLNKMKSQYATDWLNLMQTAGPEPYHTSHYYAIFVKATLKSIIWYDPAKFPASERSLLTSRRLTWSKLMSLAKGLGRSPWCMGMADGSRSGWPGTNWIEDILLHQSGPTVYDKWLQGNLSWTSPQMVKAWQTFGQVAATAGGAQSELTTSYGVAGWPMFTRFTSQPTCFLDHEGSYAIAFYEGDKLGHGAHPRPGHDFNFISFPPLTPASQGVEVSGDLLAMFHDTPAACKLIAYLTTPQAQEAWTRRHASGALSVNKNVPRNLKYYPDSVSLALAKILISATNIHYDTSDSMPSAMESAFNDAVMQYLASPTRTQLMVILHDLDKVRTATYQQAQASG